MRSGGAGARRGAVRSCRASPFHRATGSRGAGVSDGVVIWWDEKGGLHHIGTARYAALFVRDQPEQVGLRNLILQTEVVEQPFLPGSLTHHRGRPPCL